MSPEQLLGRAELADGEVLVADLEAGIGTLTRVSEGMLDAVVIVAEPTAKSLDVARRAAALAVERKIPRVMVVANRIADEAAQQEVRAALAELTDVVIVPDDPAVRAAERDGEAPLDVAPDAPAVKALQSVAAWLLPATG